MSAGNSANGEESAKNLMSFTNFDGIEDVFPEKKKKKSEKFLGEIISVIKTDKEKKNRKRFEKMQKMTDQEKQRKEFGDMMDSRASVFMPLKTVSYRKISKEDLDFADNFFDLTTPKQPTLTKNNTLNSMKSSPKRSSKTPTVYEEANDSETFFSA